MPIDYLRGNISGRQDIEYNGADAYSLADGEVVSADDYQPRLVTKVARLGRPNMMRFFQVRTRTSVNMSAAMRSNLALMGGAGALFAALCRDKTAQIYTDCVRVCPRGETLRSFIVPLLRAGLAAKQSSITIADGVVITNPWIYSGTQTLNVPASVISKFAGVLSNS